MFKPMDNHWNAVKRILKYLAITMDFGVHFQPSTMLVINDFFDIDWAPN